MGETFNAGGPPGSAGASGPAGTTLHAGLTDVSSNQHHAKSHAHDGADGSGTVAYSNVTGTPGLGDVRTISVNTTLAADNSWTPVGYCQIASGVVFEIASGAVVEILS